MYKQSRQLVLNITSALLVSGATSTASAQFPLNFQPSTANQVNGPSNLDCRNGSGTQHDCVRGTNLPDPDKTPFYQEIVEGTDGDYYHVIVGSDPDADGSTSDFALEFYIKTLASPNGWFTGAPYNASGGAMFNGGIDSQPSSPLARDPLSRSDPNEPFRNSGNASGNPKRVIFRQVINTGPEFRQEAIKETFLNKPKITQAVTTSELTSTFELNMSNSTYDDLNTAGTLTTNRTMVLDASTGAPLFDFDSVSDSQKSDVTGGEFIYNPGTFFDQSFGSYTYSEGAFDIYGIDWALYSDPSNVPNQ